MWLLILIAVGLVFCLAVIFIDQIRQLLCHHVWQIEGWNNVEGNRYHCFLCGKRSTDRPFILRSLRKP